MAQNRFYSSVATKTSLTASISNAATSFVVGTLAGYPVSLPFTAIIDRDTVNEEIITVTGVSGTTVTGCIRGADGSAAISHSAGATFEHGVSARDFSEPQAHIAASSGVHGITGNVVGTTDVQTLTSKTLTSPTLNFPVINNATGTNNSLQGTGLSGVTTVTGTVDAHAAIFTPGADANVGMVIRGNSLTQSGDSLQIQKADLSVVAKFDASGNLTAPNVTSAWTSYTPTLTGMSIGNGSVVGRYIKIGKTVVFSVDITIGSTTTVSAGVSFSLPAGAASAQEQFVPVRFYNGSANLAAGVCTIAASGVTGGVWLPASSTSSALSNYAGTALGVGPSSGQNIIVQGAYEAA